MEDIGFRSMCNRSSKALRFDCECRGRVGMCVKSNASERHFNFLELGSCKAGVK